MNRALVFKILVNITFTVYILWWILVFLTLNLNMFPDLGFAELGLENYFTDTYGIMALMPAVFGIFIAKKWGFLKSIVGKAVLFFSLGLLFQSIGQISYTYLYYAYGLENTYPAFGEIFYVLTIPTYILGVWFIAKASGFQITFLGYKKNLWAALIPVLMLALSFWLFFKDYAVFDQQTINMVLDFVYPIGQAMFVSLALVVFFTTKSTLGGVMKKRVVFMLLSLVSQYFADTQLLFS